MATRGLKIRDRRWRPALTRERIVAAALAEIEAVAWGGHAWPGKRLGCEAMSIYHHFPSKRHLLDALVDHALGSLEWGAPELPPSSSCGHRCTDTARWRTGSAALYPLVALHRLNTDRGARHRARC